MGMAELKASQAKLDQIEKAEIPGATVLTPKAQMLDASDVERQHPDKFIRWVNIRDRQKAEARQLTGYVRLSEDEGGRHLGDELALVAIPKKQHEARTEAIKKLNDERMRAHHTAMEQMAESVARMARDQYGIKLDPRRILVDE